MEDYKKETHESYGVIGVCRRSSKPPVNLVGSSINHSQTMAISVKRCEKIRELNRTWFFGRETLLEVELSPVQFAEMITNANVGDGVPCTIRFLADKGRIEDPPEISQRQVYEKEFKDTINNFGKTCYGDIKEAKEILLKKGNITVKERQQVAGIIQYVVNNITSHLPFIQSSFNKSMSKTALEAKSEVEAFVTNKINSLGIEALKDQLPMLSMPDDEKEE